MRPRNRRSRSCTYAVAIDGAMSQNELQRLAQYLSTLAPAGCEVLVLDTASPTLFDSRQCVLRWVARHIAVQQQEHSDEALELVRAAAAAATTDKVIFAAGNTRYSADEIGDICTLLDRHDVVEPEEYVGPLPWWGAVEAGGMLLYRGVERPRPDRSTFAFRRSAFRPLHGFSEERIGPVPGLAFIGADVHEAQDLFVRKEPPSLLAWLRTRRLDAFDPASPMRTFFFLAAIPLLIFLAIAGGMDIAGGYAAVVGFASVVLAVRGRIGASRVFPIRACLFAPLWILERSMSASWSMFTRLRAATASPSTAGTVRANERAASGQ